MALGTGLEPIFDASEAPVLPIILSQIKNGAHGETRTHNIWFLKPTPLPIGLLGH